MMVEFKPVNQLMIPSTITQPSPSPLRYTNPQGEENLYVRFEYVQQTICKHTPIQVAVPMNADPLNTINKIQQSTKINILQRT